MTKLRLLSMATCMALIASLTISPVGAEIEEGDEEDATEEMVTTPEVTPEVTPETTSNGNTEESSEVSDPGAEESTEVSEPSDTEEAPIVLGGTVAFEQDRYHVGENPVIVGTLQVQPIKNKIEQIKNEYGDRIAFATALQNTVSHFTAYATVSPELDSAFRNTTKDNVTEFNSKMFDVTEAHYDEATHTVIVNMGLKKEYTTFRALYDDLQAENDPLVMKITSPNAYAPERQPIPFVSSWMVNNKEVASNEVLMVKPGETLNVNNLFWDDLKVKAEPTLANIPDDATSSLTFSMASDLVDQAPRENRQSNLQGAQSVRDKINEGVDLLKTGAEEPLFTYKVSDDQKGERVLASRFRVTVMTDRTFIVDGLVMGDFSSDASLAGVNRHFEFSWNANTEVDTTIFEGDTQEFYSDYLLKLNVPTMVVKRPESTPHTATPVEALPVSMVGLAALAGLLATKKRLED